MKDYKKEAEKYCPKDNIKLLFIAESPPPFNDEKDQRYFYFMDSTKYDNLFRETTKILLSPSDLDLGKYEKLKLLQKIGFFLIDACKSPIKKKTSPSEKKKIIKANKDYLLNQIKSLVDNELMDKQTPIVLITKPVYCIVLPYLLLEGYNVLNAKNMDFVNFPGGGTNTNEFRKKLKEQLQFTELLK